MRIKGASPLIATVLIVVISFAALSVVILIGMPVINKAKEAAILTEALQYMRSIDNAIREVASEGTGSLRTITLKVSGGEYEVNDEANSFDFIYDIEYGLVELGRFVKEGNLLMMSGVGARASEYDIDDDGNSELVLENSIMKVGIQKNGTSTNYQFINTTRNIRLLNLKDNNITITPEDSSILLDDFQNSTYGNGYSKLIKSGDHLGKAEALVHVNSTNFEYDVVYTLPASADFLIVRVENAYYRA